MAGANLISFAKLIRAAWKIRWSRAMCRVPSELFRGVFARLVPLFDHSHTCEHSGSWAASCFSQRTSS